ncbi:MAG TPA: LLM class flavin-dependent oxidoreductase [Chloroflexota bacterium]|nr:LLM class flavin-dependent oxidoreductase [Chloroflexota bacterium]
MRFAVRVPTSNKVASRAAIVDVAQAAEALGFYAVSLHDHLVFNGWWVACGAREAAGAGDDRDMYEALVTLSYVAGKTERVKLMTAILLLPTRETVLMAKQVATLDVLAEGRVILGVGIGPQVERGEHGATSPEAHLSGHASNALKEYDTFRVPRQRGRMADEQLAAMRAIWTQDVASFDGQFVQFHAIEVFPKPVQPGGPPIWVGGRSRAALRRVLLHGNAWHPNVLTPQQYGEGVAALRQMAADLGRPAPTDWGLNVFSCVAASDDEAMALFGPEMGERFPGDVLRSRNLVGSPETVVRRLQEFQAAGLNVVELKPIYRSVPDLIRMLELIAREVMPALQTEPTPARA